jgi:hypothetical protein
MASAQNDANQALANQDSSPLAELAQSLGLTLAYTNSVVLTLTRDILLTMYERADPEMQGRIKKAYMELYPRGKFAPDGNPIISTFLLGPPGHGKTSVMREASRRAAELCGLNFLDNPPESVEVTAGDYVFLSMEFAGVNSAIQIRGIPYKMKDETSQEEYLSFLKDRALSSLDRAGGATLCLDDILNASSAMVNVALPLAEEKRYSGTHLKGTYVGATGNLGSFDGTKTSGITSAFRNRARMLMVRDNYMDVAKRLRNKYTHDELGDLYFSNFLERKGAKLLETIPTSEQWGGFASPRSVEKALLAHRLDVNTCGGREYAIDALEMFDENVGSILGKEAGMQLKAYLNSAYTDADPMARKLIMEGKLDPRVEEYASKPKAMESIAFFHMFGDALADWMSLRVRESADPTGKVLEESLDRFCTGLYKMDGAPFSAGLHLFRERLTNRVPELAQTVGQGKNQNVIFSKVAIDRITNVFLNHPEYDNGRLTDISNIISNASLYSSMAVDVNVTPSAPRAAGTSKTAKAGK